MTASRTVPPATWPAPRWPASTSCCLWPESPERCYLPCALLMMTSWVSSPSPTMDAAWASDRPVTPWRDSQRFSEPSRRLPRLPGRRRTCWVEAGLRRSGVVIAVPESSTPPSRPRTPQMVASDMPKVVGSRRNASDRHRRWQDNHFLFVGSTISQTGDCGDRDAGLSLVAPAQLLVPEAVDWVS